MSPVRTRGQAAARRGVNGRPRPAARSRTTAAARKTSAAKRSPRPRTRPGSPARSGPVPSFPLRAAAALFLERQHLDRPRQGPLDAASLVRFAEDVGGIQLDSINVLDRAHHLTLWSRFGPYDRAAFERLCYQDRLLFEYWAHAACLVPTSHFAWWRRAMLDYRLRHTGWTSWLRKNPKVVRGVEDAVRERGPLGNADFRQPRPGGKSGWWSWKPATHAFHYLWMTGRLLIHSRVHFQKRFELAERMMPGAMALDPADKPAFERWHVERSLHALGAATELDLRLYLTFPRFERNARRRRLEALVREGEVIEIAVEGDRHRWFVRARDLAALERSAANDAPSGGTTLLAPFDSFLWHRARTSRLFGYDYRIEVYTPGPQRVHGYYTLPILHDGQLIGRLDAKNHRSEERLEARHVHLEDWFAKGGMPPAAAWGPLDRDRALAGIAEALRSLASHLGARKITVGRVSPARLGAAVKKAIRSREAEPA